MSDQLNHFVGRGTEKLTAVLSDILALGVDTSLAAIYDPSAFYHCVQCSDCW